MVRTVKSCISLTEALSPSLALRNAMACGDAGMKTFPLWSILVMHISHLLLGKNIRKRQTMQIHKNLKSQQSVNRS